MSPDSGAISYEDAKALAGNATTALKPRLPITTQELFAGRWDELTTLADAVRQPGLHVAIYGERGVGKTSLANIVRPTIQAFDGRGPGQPTNRIVIKANANSGDQFSTIWTKLFADITWHDDRPAVGLTPHARRRTSLSEAFCLPQTLQIDDVRRTLASLPGSVFIIDEFDRAAKATSLEFTDLLKALSDYEVDCTIMLVGVSDTIDQLVSDHASISRGLIQIQLRRMKKEELQIILENAEKTLNIRFSQESKNLIVHLSQGLPHYTHLIGLHTVRKAALERFTSRISTQDVFAALKEAVKQAEQTVTEKHAKAVHSAHKDALFRHVLLACALSAATSHDALGYFNPVSLTGPLQLILGRYVEVATFNNHLAEFCQPKRGSVLERTGQSRAYRYRFHDPLLVPFVFMDALNTGMITDENLALLGAEF
jgi:Cdc6-like AAA superfamily ATPase